MVEQADDLAAEDRHRVVAHLRRAVGVAVAEEVEAQDAVAAVGNGGGERPLHLAREEQPGEQDDGPVAAAVLVEYEAVSLVAERAFARLQVRLSLPGGAPRSEP